MNGWLLVISRDANLIRGLRAAAMRDGRACQLWAAESIERARALLGERQNFPLLVVLDEPFLHGASLAEMCEEFAWCAPVLAIGTRDPSSPLAPLVRSGRVDLVARNAEFLPLALALADRALGWEQEIDRRIREAEAEAVRDGRSGWLPDPDNFPAEALRLIGSILENLEAALSDSRLAPAAARRLGHAADLAFDLKSGLRLLAGRSPAKSAS